MQYYKVRIDSNNHKTAHLCAAKSQVKSQLVHTSYYNTRTRDQCPRNAIVMISDCVYHKENSLIV